MRLVQQLEEKIGQLELENASLSTSLSELAKQHATTVRSLEGTPLRHGTNGVAEGSVSKASAVTSSKLRTPSFGRKQAGGGAVPEAGSGLPPPPPPADTSAGEITAYKEQAIQLQNECTRLIAQMSKLTTRHTEEMATMQSEKEQWQRTAETLSSELKTATTQNESLSKAVKEKNGEIEELKQLVHTTTKDLRDSHQRLLDGTEKTVKELQQCVDHTQHENAALLARNQELLRELNALEDRYAVDKKSLEYEIISTTETFCKQVESQRQLWDRERSELCIQIASLTRELEVTREQSQGPSLAENGKETAVLDHGKGESQGLVKTLSQQIAHFLPESWKQQQSLATPGRAQQSAVVDGRKEEVAPVSWKKQLVELLVDGNTMDRMAQEALLAHDADRLQKALEIQLQRYHHLRKSNAKLLRNLQAFKGNIQVRSDGTERTVLTHPGAGGLSRTTAHGI